MFRSTGRILCILAVVLGLSMFTQISLGQMTLSWYKETPASENHLYRAVAVDNIGKYFYVTDLQTDVVYVYLVSKPDVPVGSFGDPSWLTPTFGPYGIDMSQDGFLYISVMKAEDADGDGLADHSVWRYDPATGKLIRICILPDYPRGIKAYGAGAKTLLLVSGSYGNVIACRPITSERFSAQIVFPTGVSINQQSVVASRSGRSIYVSTWTDTPPFASPVTKWSPTGTRDESFSIGYLTTGNVPGLELTPNEQTLYVFHISIPPTTGARIYAVSPTSGQMLDQALIGPSGANGGANIDLSPQGDIYFARSLESRDGMNISAYGVVSVSQATASFAAGTDQKNAVQFRNYPNPFNPSTSIRYSLSLDSHVKIEVLNTLGQRVALLIDEAQQAGDHEVRFDGSGVPSGTYFYRVQAGDYSNTYKMMLVK